MTRYDHVLAAPLDRRGIKALFSVAVTEPMQERAWTYAFGRWCDRLQHRAATEQIIWLPASGAAITFVALPTKDVEAALLRIIERTPAFPDRVCHRPTLRPGRQPDPEPST